MARKKMERVPELDLAEARLAALKSIDPALDLGNDRSIRIFSNAIADARAGVSDYNQNLSMVDGKYNAALQLIKDATRLSKNMLSGVWGTDSTEHEKAGGTRFSERKKPGRKPKDPAKGK